MAKQGTTIRIYELARELDKESKEIIEAGQALDLGIKTSSSAGLTDEQADAIRKHLNAEKAKSPLKLSLAVKKSAPKKKAKKKAVEPEPEPDPEPKEEAPAKAKPKRVLTAAEVKRRAKIKKRKEREEEQKRLKKIAEQEKKEKAAARKKKTAAKKAAKADKKEETAPEPVEEQAAPAAPEPEQAPAPKPKVKAPEKKVILPKARKKSKITPIPEYKQVPIEEIKKIDLDAINPKPAPKEKTKPVYKVVKPAKPSKPDMPAAVERKTDAMPTSTFQPRGGGGRRRKPSHGGGNRYNRSDRNRGDRRRKRRKEPKQQQTVEPTLPSIVEVYAPISIRDFSQLTGIKAQSIILKMLNEGIVSNINTVIDRDSVEYLAEMFEREITFKEETNIEDDFLAEFKKEDDPKDLVQRKPIVTFLGHVDHGKTSLLDSIREAGVVKTESGGITQHTSAYMYQKDGKEITFIDTPGHAVFTEMRSRGANVTDIVVLIVAADDGIMPQTREAYDHAVAAEVPIIVAMNKCDLPTADPNRVLGQLAEMGLTPEEWGGKTQVAQVSAITGEGVDSLLEMIMLETEMTELTANPQRPAEGVVLETNLSDSSGIVVSMIIKNGTLKRGDVFICGKTYGRARHMWDPEGKQITEAGPSTPIDVTGFNVEPIMGDHLYGIDDIQKAKAIAEKRVNAVAGTHIERAHISMANLFDSITQQKLRELNIIVKADAKGSLEAILKGLGEIGNTEVAIKVVHAGVGGINESDVMLADASNAIIIGFHVSPEPRVDILSDAKGVEIRRYHVIYEIFKELEEALSGMLAPDQVEETLGRVEIRKVFVASSIGTIAGCFVRQGVVRKNANIRLLRNNIEIFDGKIDSLKRVKDDVSEVKENFECGIKVTGFNDIKEGDEFEVYIVKEVERKLSSVTDKY